MRSADGSGKSKARLDEVRYVAVQRYPCVVVHITTIHHAETLTLFLRSFARRG